MLGQRNNRMVDFSATSAESASAGSGFSSKMSRGGSDLASSAVYKEKQTQWGSLCLQYGKPKVYKDCGWGCAWLGCGVEHADHKGGEKKMTWVNRKTKRNEKPTTTAWNKWTSLKNFNQNPNTVKVTCSKINNRNELIKTLSHSYKLFPNHILSSLALT